MGAHRAHGMWRVNVFLAFRFFTAVAALSCVRLLIPANVFASLSSQANAAIEALPLLLIAMIWLNLSIPQGNLKVRGYVIYALLLAPAVVGFMKVQAVLSLWMPMLTDTLDIWALSSLTVYMLRPMALAFTLFATFTLLWKLSFGMGKRMRIQRLISPWFWSALVLGAVVISYVHMVNYAQLNAPTTVYGTLFGQVAPDSAFWYRVDPITALLLYWTAQPLETLFYGFAILGGMRMFRAAYPNPVAARTRPEQVEVPAKVPLLEDPGHPQSTTNARTLLFSQTHTTFQPATRNHPSPFSKPMATAFPGPSGAFPHKTANNSPDRMRQFPLDDKPQVGRHAKTG